MTGMRAIGIVFTLVAVALVSMFAGAGQANEAPDSSGSRFQMLKDPEDGKFDMSVWLGTATGFLPSPIIITEPAVGYGGGLYHLGIWSKDRIRYLGLAAYASVNYDFYPPSGSPLPVNSVPVNIEGSFIRQQLTLGSGT